MAIYAIGEVNGDYSALMRLLDAIEFNQETDRLWSCGNLAGPHPEVSSLLNFIRNLNGNAVCVLGEQEVSLLSLARSTEQKNKSSAFHGLLNAENSEEITSWLSQWPLFHFDRRINFAMVHAGLPADWSLSQLSTFSIEAETALTMNQQAYFENTRGQPPRRWNAKLQGWKRLHFIISVFTLMRKTTSKGYMDFGFRLAPMPPLEEYLSWFSVPGRATQGLRVIFCGKQPVPPAISNVYALYPGNYIADLPGVMKLSSK